MLQQSQPQPRYKTVRTIYRRKARSRKSALPVASALFLCSILFLGIYYARSNRNTSPATLSTTSAARDLDLLGVATSRAGGTDYGDLCTGDSLWARKWLLVFLIPAVVFAFVGLALVTDDYFVAALERICERLDLTEDVAGATFMAAGSSTPEFFASMLGTFVTRDSVGIGTIVGSAVFNILVIVGLSAALAGSVLALDWRPLMRDSFFYVVSIVLLMVFTLLFGPSGVIRWYEGLILVLTYVAYVLFMAYLNKPYMKWAKSFSRRGRDTQDNIDVEAGAADAVGGAGDPTRSWEDKKEEEAARRAQFRSLPPRTRLKVAQYAIIAAQRLQSSSSSNSEMFQTAAGGGEGREGGGGGGDGDGGGGGGGGGGDGDNQDEAERTLIGVELPSSTAGWIFFPFTFVWSMLFRFTIPDCSSDDKAHRWWLTFLLSIVWISGISYVMVEAARISGCLVGIPATAMGLTVLAAGTSVPDALASISVARGGAGDMAVSNAIGSNVFDILLGLGVPWFLGDLTLSPQEGNSHPIMIPTDPLSVVVVPIAILFGILIAFVLTLMLFRWKLRPLIGYILFGMYGAFVVYTIVDVYVISA